MIKETSVSALFIDLSTVEEQLWYVISVLIDGLELSSVLKLFLHRKVYKGWFWFSLPLWKVNGLVCWQLLLNTEKQNSN